MMVKTFLPAVRGVIVYRLRKNGYGQPTIAKLVGITQAAVSQILSKDEKKYFDSLEKMGVSKNEIVILADTLCNMLVESPAQATAILYSFWRSLLSEGRFCSYHRTMYPQLIGCDICMMPALDKVLDEEKITVLKTLDKCVKKLEESQTFERLIPEVGVNIVYCLRGASSTAEVAGVAGRIVALDKRVKSVGRPSFGGSNHLASVLLVARAYDASIRSAINIKNNSQVRKVLEEMGISFVEIEPRMKIIDEKDVLQDIDNCFRQGALEAVLHGGGVGYEPITYIFGKNPEDLVNTVLKVSEKVLNV